MGCVGLLFVVMLFLFVWITYLKLSFAGVLIVHLLVADFSSRCLIGVCWWCCWVCASSFGFACFC